MANSLTPRDAHALMEAVVKQATGEEISILDTSTFTAVGEKLLRTGTENTLNAISTVLARTIFSVRPYKSRFASLEVSPERWGAQIRKIITLYVESEASTDYNTEGTPTQLADGNSVDMYKIKAPKAVQLNFYGTQKLQKHITIFRDQLALAFRDETEFNRFIMAVMVQFSNEIELLNEAKSRATLLNFMAGISSMGLTEVDLTKEFNTENGTTYTREELLSAAHLEDFMKFTASTIKIYSSRLVDMSELNHAQITGQAKILRHTPKGKQKMFMYEPVFIKTQATVYSSIFNPEYLDIGSFEGVNYWQSQTNPTEIKVTPNILDVATGNSKTAETTVYLPYVLGLLTDEEAVGVMPQFDYSSTTPFNSAGGYYNNFMHWRFNSFNDFTENAVLFVMGAGGAADTPVIP